MQYRGAMLVRDGREAILKALLAMFLCVITAGCANGWPSTHHPQPASAQAAQGCKTSGSRILHSDCSTMTPSSQMSGDELDREKHSNGNGTGGMATPH